MQEALDFWRKYYKFDIHVSVGLTKFAGGGGVQLLVESSVMRLHEGYGTKRPLNVVFLSKDFIETIRFMKRRQDRNRTTR